MKNRWKQYCLVTSWLSSQYILMTSIHSLCCREEKIRTHSEGTQIQLWELRCKLKDVLTSPRLSTSQATWIHQRVEELWSQEFACVMLGILSCDSQKCLQLERNPLSEIPLCWMLKRKANLTVAFYCLMFLSNTLHHVGKCCELLQKFSLEDATAVCELHIEKQAIVLAYLHLWYSLGTCNATSPLSFSHGVLVGALEYHSEPSIVVKVLGALERVSRATKGYLCETHPHLVSWVVQQSLGSVTHRPLLMKSISIVSNLATIKSTRTKEFIYQQGAGKLLFVVISAVQWDDVKLLRQSLQALVCLISALDVAWHAVISDKGLPIIASLLKSGEAKWPKAMKHSRTKAEWVKARSLVFRTQYLLQRV